MSACSPLRKWINDNHEQTNLSGDQAIHTHQSSRICLLSHVNSPDRLGFDCLSRGRGYKIQVLITTATFAWDVNFPAHLVVIKGTEHYDGKLKRYIDIPITDILQMMGRTGRPQFDNSGVAVILVHDLKNFYRKFVYQSFPVESSLMGVLPDHINAEIVTGTIKNR